MESVLAAIRPRSTDPTIATASFDGTGWSKLTAIRDQPGSIDVEGNEGPSVVTFNNWTYLIYPGDSSNNLYCAWFDGAEWKGGVPIRSMNGGIAPQSEHSPGIVVFRGMLMIAYVRPSDTHVRTAWFDGTSWVGDDAIDKQNGGIDPESLQPPEMCVFDDKLYLVYPFLGTIYTCTFDGVVWEGNDKIEDQKGGLTPSDVFEVAAAIFQSELFIAWTDSTSHEAYTATFGRSTWTGGTSIGSQPGGVNPVEYFAPSLEVFQGRLLLFFLDRNSGQAALASYDGSQWSGGQAIGFGSSGSTSNAKGDRIGVAVTAPPPPSANNWLSRIPGDAKISALNLPGTHDSAAINSTIHTAYATQNQTITEQLNAGVRLLD